MPPVGVARKDEKDPTASPDGGAPCCGGPAIHATDEGSDTVFVETIGVVREGDKMKKHPYNGACCSQEHAPALSTFSSTVFVEGKRLGRKDDDYSLHVISAASLTVFAGG
jgi:uncharacterized Zn-binding protein involved in type VI secretion